MKKEETKMLYSEKVKGFTAAHPCEELTAGGAALLGYMIVLSAAAFTIWTALLGRFPVGRVSLFGFLIPVFGAVFSALVLGENIMNVRNLLSVLLVIGGIALANSVAASSKS